MAYNYLPINAPEPLTQVEEAIRLAVKEVPRKTNYS